VACRGLGNGEDAHRVRDAPLPDRHVASRHNAASGFDRACDGRICAAPSRHSRSAAV